MDDTLNSLPKGSTQLLSNSLELNTWKQTWPIWQTRWTICLLSGRLRKIDVSNEIVRIGQVREDLIERSFIFERQDCEIHHDNAKRRQAGNTPKQFFSETINREDLNVGTRIPELLCYLFMKMEPAERQTPCTGLLATNVH